MLGSKLTVDNRLSLGSLGAGSPGDDPMDEPEDDFFGDEGECEEEEAAEDDPAVDPKDSNLCVFYAM